MKPEILLKHEFVEFIPDDLRERTIYVSIRYATVAHKCCCGCGNEVVTPLSPTDWKLVFDGKTISLDPSIGNWGLPCKSHYWIRNNRVKWAAAWSQAQIDQCRSHEQLAKERYYDAAPPATETGRPHATPEVRTEKAGRGFWRTLRRWLS